MCRLSLAAIGGGISPYPFPSIRGANCAAAQEEPEQEEGQGAARLGRR